MAKAYYGSKISEHITKLSDGCIICHDVPIARTGTYKYLGSEVGMDTDEIVDVHREPEQVFSKKTIASFEGKAFCDMHPSVDVNIDNWPIYSKGELHDVRRGTGEMSDYLMADIVVRDSIVANKILSGAEREISAGYECEYVEKDGKIYQQNIIGNHAALVQAGRAGPMVSIKDEAPKAKPDMSKYHSLKKIMEAIKACD